MERERLSNGLIRHRDLVVDVFWALASFAIAILMFASGGLGPAEHDQRGLDLLGVFVAAGISFPLLARRRAPVPVFLAVMGALVALVALRYPPDVTIGPIIALFTLARASGREVPARLAVGIVVGFFLAVAAALSLADNKPPFPEMTFIGLIWLAIWFAGRSARLKAEHISDLEERAERAEQMAERERRLVAAEERTRIARDLHDSAGHAINVILVEAGAARLLRDRDPERAEQAIETIESVAREQIDEIDQLVHALREGDRAEKTPLGDSEVALGMKRGKEAVEALFELHRATGLDLRVSRVGEGRTLGPSVGRAVFRLLQESLTNATRHGDGSAEVVFSFRDDALEVTVANPVANPASNGEPPAEGHGLAGMRERAALVGGTLEAIQANGTFRVRAVLPYDPRYQAPAEHFAEPGAARNLAETKDR
ncbi:MAG: sensor histidine kinase [Solirubrobacterales bacterium]